MSCLNRKAPGPHGTWPEWQLLPDALLAPCDRVQPFFRKFFLPMYLTCEQSDFRKISGVHVTWCEREDPF
ncbi:hypothetical protein AV530_002709 [Patagioenas fasciata monilis]|uniref:Uncharacterized protein n=1 Tax=Patagioenas fasciata monilis TaxID=372326 RepID=A0A1V4IQC5_PATFA|nr:hypothetical protein AV530_002709 [Patagioenas fasciata monilis]